MLGPLSTEDRRLQHVGKLPKETRDYLNSKKPSTGQVILWGLSVFGLFGCIIVQLIREIFRS